LINILGPLGLVMLLGMIYQYLRKKRFSVVRRES